MSAKKPLEPLIPLAEFGKLVGKIARVPKSAVAHIKPKPPKAKRTKSKTAKRKRPTKKR
jgi:hypothetical protein